MRIATWNVNSIRARLPRVVEWLREHQPDVLCMQETKVEDEHFPREPLEDEGYNVEAFGQKTYNGVAILARHPIEVAVRGLPHSPLPAEPRLLGARIGDLTVLNVYVPNGQQVGSERFAAKLAWLACLRGFLDATFTRDQRLLVAGDFNITFDDRDVFDPEALREQLHCSTPERAALALVMGFGLADALRRFHEQTGIYTWWDYQAGAFAHDQGLRIDHVLLTAPALERCTGIAVDREARKGKGPSDHVPVIATFADAH